MDDAPRPFTFEQFTTAVMASENVHTGRRWILARTRSGEQPTWLGGFAGNHPVWVASVDEAATYHHDGAEAARLRCTALPDHTDVLYGVCRFKTNDDTGSHDNEAKPMSSFEAGMLDSVRRLNASEELRREIAKRIS